ncbi:MAG: T9SS type A sorting domain-containing protein, partial [Lentimicrobiaceae bacterium]|nr:T9SS type A sorting domain-containing protein [Lentimicrobiaceae bacterium]
GVHSLQLANSGMYFVRFTSENAQVIRRVIVR